MSLSISRYLQVDKMFHKNLLWWSYVCCDCLSSEIPEYCSCPSCCLDSLCPPVKCFISLFSKYLLNYSHSPHSNTAAMFARSFGNFGNFDSKTSTRQLSNGGMASQIESYWFTIILTKIITAGLLTVCCICIDNTTRISGAAGLAS